MLFVRRDTHAYLYASGGLTLSISDTSRVHIPQIGRLAWKFIYFLDERFRKMC